MAHESFETPDIAKQLNDSYISIKVDSEERPDIDSVYMSVCQAFTGSGGWPMSIFMTLDKKPFFEGTYFPQNSRFGMPGFADVLNALAQQWNTEQDRLMRSAEHITQRLKSSEEVSASPGD